MSILCAFIAAVLFILILTHPARAQRDVVSNLYARSTFDWYVAKPGDRMASAVAILSERFMPTSEEEFSKFKNAASFLVDCVSNQIGIADSQPVARLADKCMARIEAQGLLK